jgi:hypothetical protein
VSIDVRQVRGHIIRPVLGFLAESNLLPQSLAAEQLVVGTFLTESAGVAIVQYGSGPARGPCQMEPFTHDDIWKNWLSHPARKPLADKLHELETLAHITRGADEMIGNWFYAFAMCRVFYRRLAAPLPAAGDALALASYWKKWYNSLLGKGSVDKALPFFTSACNG